VMDLSLYVIVDPEIEASIPLERFIEEVYEGGATALQVRYKQTSTRLLLDFSRRVLARARSLGLPVIVNDRLDVALAAGAQGVHLGQDDLPIGEARQIAPADFIIGASVRNVDEARAAHLAGADYLGVGPIFASPTKPDLDPIGPEQIARINLEISLPIVAIGGINETNAALAVTKGADGVAVVSALRQCESPKTIAARIRAAVDKAKKG